MADLILDHKVPIDSFSFNGDKSQMAVALANHTVEIYENSRGKWGKVATLAKHVARVTGIDWAPKTNKILTTSADRNAYVWETLGDNKWTAVLVILRISRSAVCCQWSPDENKFAVGSAARQVTICYYEPNQKCWVSKHIRKPIKSTVVSVAWHPKNYVLAIGSTDNHCRVYSGYVKDCEEKGSDVSWGGNMKFGNCLVEFKCQGWVTACSFSPSGTELAFVAHDGSLQITSVATKDEPSIKYYGTNLPFSCIEWSAADRLIAAGHDRSLFGFAFKNNEITCEGHHLGNSDKKSGKSSAMRTFMNISDKGVANAKNTGPKPVHYAPVCDLQIFEGEKGNIQKIASGSTDGHVHVWDWSDLSSKLEALKL